MSETASEISSREQVKDSLSLPVEMKDFLIKKFGLSEEDIVSISKDEELIPSLDNLLKNSDNETEKKIFIEKYLSNIYDRIIAEAKAVGKDPVDYALSKGKSESFAEGLDSYLVKKAAIEDGKRIAGKEQAAIERRAREAGIDQAAIERNKIKEEDLQKLEKSSERGRNALSPEGQTELASLTEAKKSDPSFTEELKKQGYTDEQITGMSESTKTTLASSIVIVEASSIFKKKGFIKDVGVYESAVKEISDTLKITRPIESLDKVPVAPGGRRESIIQAGTELLQSGKYNDKSLTYNSKTGRIVFEPNSPGIPRAEIDTSRIPPVLEYIEGTLRIGRDIPPVDPRIKEKTGLLEKKSKLDAEYTKGLLIPFANIGEGPDFGSMPKKLIEQSRGALEEHRRNQIDFQKKVQESGISDPIGTLELIKKLRTTNTTLDQARLNSIDIDNLSDPTMRSLEEGLFEERRGIDSLEKTLIDMVSNNESLKKYEDVSSAHDTGFEQGAKSTLAKLSEMGYSILGQKSLDRLMRALAQNGSGIWKNGSLNMDSLGDREMQLRELESVAEKITLAYPGSPKTRENAFLEIARMLKSINTGPVMERIWSNPQLLNQWLAKLGMKGEQNGPETLR